MFGTSAWYMVEAELCQSQDKIRRAGLKRGRILVRGSAVRSMSFFYMLRPLIDTGTPEPPNGPWTQF